MKRNYVWAAALLMLAACTHEDVLTTTDNPDRGNGGQRVTVTATLPGNDSRVALEEVTENGKNIIKVAWNEPDYENGIYETFTVMTTAEQHVTSDEDDMKYRFIQTEGNQFTGTLPDKEEGELYYAFYPLVDLGWIGETGNFEYIHWNNETEHPDDFYTSFSAKKVPGWALNCGKLEDMTTLPMYATSTDGKQFDFHHLTAIVKFTLTGLPQEWTEEGGKDFHISWKGGCGTLGTLDLTQPTVAEMYPATGDEGEYSVSVFATPVDGTCTFYACLPPVAQGKTLTIKYIDYTEEDDLLGYTAKVELTGKGIEAGKYYRAERTMTKISTSMTAGNVQELQTWVEGFQKFGGINLTLTADITLTDADDLDSDPDNNSNWPVWLDLYGVTIDGGGHTLTGLKMNVTGEGEAASMFCNIDENSVVKNLHLRNVQLSSSGYYAAGVVASNAGTVSGCSVSGTVECTADGYSAGGVVGINSGTVIACYSTGEVTAGTNGYAGGVVGANQGTVTACYSTGEVSATGTNGRAGGVVGSGYDFDTVTTCYWSGTGATNGIGYDYGLQTPSNEGTTQVTDDSWNPTALNAMNAALPTGFGWQYVTNGDDNTYEAFPLVLVSW